MTVADTVQHGVDQVKEAVGLGNGHGAPSRPATREEMSAHKLPLAYRDSCAHLLIPLNKCRYDNYYLTWRCMVDKHNAQIRAEFKTNASIQDERHSYEKCQYEEFKLRVKKMDEIRAEKGGARSN